MNLSYEHDGQRIYDASFATIRAEADLCGVPADLEPVVVRMIHACGDVDIVPLVEASPGFVAAARRALRDGRPIWCDSQMVADGITRRRLPAANAVGCTLRDPGIAEAAAAIGNTRSAAAVDRWLGDDGAAGGLDGSVAVIGNAPTA
ncbi:MAG: cobH, partial [Ilumatobacteraceae bacterium]|nr:cobH [Ilumatobacteraceae bacterium]